VSPACVNCSACVGGYGPPVWHLTGLEVTAGAAALAFAAAMLTLRQKAANDRRDAWWKRAQWAIDKSFSDVADEREVGVNAMDVLIQDGGVPRKDLDVLRPALERFTGSMDSGAVQGKDEA